MASPTAKDRTKTNSNNAQWNKLQDRINALKQENEELKKSIYTG